MSTMDGTRTILNTVSLRSLSSWTVGAAKKKLENAWTELDKFDWLVPVALCVTQFIRIHV